MLIVAHPPSRGKTAASLLRYLRRADEVVELFAPASVIALIVLFSLWGWFASRATRMQFDELLELSVAGASNAAGVLKALSSGIDFNPPLSHFLVRASDSLFGDLDWAARLPAFLGFAALLLFLYQFVARQLGRAYGVIAMLFILCLPVREYAIQSRPYGILLGFSALSLVCYRAATYNRRRVLPLIALALCTAVLVACHYYAVLVVGVLFAAALLRAFETRRLDWPLLISISVPPLIVLVLLRNIVLQQKHQLAHYFARGNLLSFDHGYDDFSMDPLVYCVALLFGITLLVLCRRSNEPRLSLQFIRELPPHIIALSGGLLALPLAGALITQLVTHAYLTRYFVPASIGLAVFACYALKSIAGAVPGLLAVSVLTLGLGFGKTILQEQHRSPETMPAAATLTSEPTPILFDTPESYLQVYRYLPEMRKNIWVISDPAASLHYRQYDTDDRIMLAIAQQGKAQAISLSSAVRRWPSFRLVPRSADYVWALKCVMDAGSQVSVKSAFGSSNFVFAVNVRPENLPLIDACGHQ